MGQPRKNGDVPPPPTEPAPERKQHPVVAGLIALLGVGLAIGLLAGGATLIGTKVMGLGDETTATDSTARQSMYLPKPQPTTAAASASQPTLSAATEPTGPVLTTPTQETGITLTAAQTTVSQMGRIDLSGTYTTGEGAVLQVQRFEGGWSDFPVNANVSGGIYNTFILTSRTGKARFRVIDHALNRASNPVTVTVG